MALYNFKGTKDKVWTTASGRQIPYSELEGSHLLSVITEVERRKQKDVDSFEKKGKEFITTVSQYDELLAALEEEKGNRINNSTQKDIAKDIAAFRNYVFNKSHDGTSSLNCSTCKILAIIDNWRKDRRA